MPGQSSQDLDTAVESLVPWDGSLYAANTDHHRRYDADFLATLDLEPTDRVLDVGCGSGDFTAKVAALVPDGHVVGLEPQSSMVDEATRRARANQTFVLAPAQDIARATADSDAPFDVVMSRSVLHWVPVTDHRRILEQCRQVLRPGGLLRIECGGGDNVREIVAFLSDVAASIAGARAVRAPWTFLHPGEYLDMLLEVGFDLDRGFVRTVAQRRSFDRDSVLGWLHSQAVQAYEVGLDPDERTRLRAAVDERVDELRRPDGTYDFTFVRLDLRAHAPARRCR
jgi:trans-aconitate methyltransferase